MNTFTKFALSTLLSFGLFFFAGCGDQSNGDELDQQIEEAAEALEEAADSMPTTVN